MSAVLKTNANNVINENIELVNKIAFKLKSRLPSSVEVDDLIQEGLIGLIEAAKNYKHDSEASFKTFAGIRIHGSMIDYLRSNSWTPRSVSKFSRQYKLAINNLESKLNRSPNNQEIITYMNISIKDFYQSKNDIEKSQISNINEFNEKEINNIASPEVVRDTIINQFKNTPDGETHKIKFYNALSNEIKLLKKEHQVILSLYYNEGISLKEIGNILEKTEGRISQILSKIITTLKVKMKDWC
jgi:RNA polymerase sigma factor for flagellar operon FliA